MAIANLQEAIAVGVDPFEQMIAQLLDLEGKQAGREGLRDICVGSYD